MLYRSEEERRRDLHLSEAGMRYSVLVNAALTPRHVDCQYKTTHTIIPCQIKTERAGSQKQSVLMTAFLIVFSAKVGIAAVTPVSTSCVGRERRRDGLRVKFLTDRHKRHG
jgi:hypothetical protein